jgi:hypothetical protein
MLNTSVLEYLNQKAERENSFHYDELKLKEEALKLERERFDLEREERRERMEADRKEKTMMLELLQKLVKN